MAEHLGFVFISWLAIASILCASEVPLTDRERQDHLEKKFGFEVPRLSLHQAI